MTTTTLPLPRRVLTAHDASGGCIVRDDTVQMVEFAPGLDIGSIYLQKTLNPDPATALAGADDKPSGLVKKDGIQIRFIDIHPGQTSGMHYTTTIDYAAVIFGEIEVEQHDGQVIVLRPGDVFVQFANAHKLNNKTDSPVRLFVACVASQPVLVDGKQLSEVHGTPDYTSWSE